MATRSIQETQTCEKTKSESTANTQEFMSLISSQMLNYRRFNLFGGGTVRKVLQSHVRYCSSSSSDALSGVKVLDLTRVLAGPYCTQILGDLGADVLKIERLKVGDDTRSWGPPFVGNTSTYFMSINRNKRSVCVNLKSFEGKEIIQQLALQSDVLVENYLPGKMEEYGLGYEDLKKINPQLIYCSITGYGNTGPYASRPGYDVIASSIGGLNFVTGQEDGPPCKTGVALTDLATGLYAHGAIMAALLQRQKTASGQRISVNLLSTQIACLVNLGANYLLAGQEAKRWGTAHESIVPYQAFSTSDGYMTVGGANDRQFNELCSRIGRPELFSDPKYRTNALRVKNRKQLIDEMTKTMSTKSNAEWNKIFHGANFPYGPINSLSEVFADPQVAHNHLVQEIDHSTAGTLKLVGPPVEFSGSGNRIRLPPPELGQHTESVLKDRLGYSLSQIEQLRDRGVIS
uniref:Succinyl-CoA:glutarate CoA-transferase n=1 Tax=Simocephalus serrulatus TaxID=117539 RepID=A0A4Y7NQ35_9CRUS|nr:EOG090X05UC [Simocephalus serrulatus]SVE94225.1 EOG090X05UC [Simocephalus serrulatus]